MKMILDYEDDIGFPGYATYFFRLMPDGWRRQVL